MPKNELNKVTNEPHLRKDVATGAVINVSSDEYDKYVKRKQMSREESTRIESLESELTEVKSMLRSVLDRLSND